MKKVLLGLALGAVLLFGRNASAQTTTTTTSTTTTTLLTCAGRGVKCDAQCDSPNACATPVGGITFTGVCAGASGDKNAKGALCLYTHCGSSAAICVGGPWTTTGCSADSSCASTEACISSNGNAGCGTGYSQCVAKCSNTTTTTTTSTTTTT